MQESNGAITPIPRNLQAGGLVQLAPDGADMLFLNPPTNTDVGAYYDLIYKAARDGGWGYFPEGLSYLDLVNDPRYTLQAGYIRNITQQIFDGQCAGWEVIAGHCTDAQNNVPLLGDANGNVSLGALTLLAAQQALTTPDPSGYVIIDPTAWINLSVEDQWKITALVYKEGISTVRAAIQNAVAASDRGPIQSWDQVAEQVNLIDADCFPGAEHPADCGTHYIEQIICYASNMSKQEGNPCGSK